MRRLILILIPILIALGAGCSHPRAKSERCFDEIRDMVNGRSAAEVEVLLGAPDSREAMVMAGERWIWWNYTYLDGSGYAPEERGRVVHLEIVFEPDGIGKEVARRRPKLRVSGPLGVSYVLPNTEIR